MPLKAQPQTYILSLRTHKLSAFLTAGLSDTIDSIKKDVLSALMSKVMHVPNPHAEMLSSEAMEADDDAAWELPEVHSVNHFELCRGLKEKGRYTGAYEQLEDSAIVRNTLVNWESIFVRFRDSHGELLPVKVSLPDIDHDDEADTPATRKGKRKAPPEWE